MSLLLSGTEKRDFIKDLSRGLMVLVNSGEAEEDRGNPVHQPKMGYSELCLLLLLSSYTVAREYQSGFTKPYSNYLL